jgi:hypothetical protein
MTACEKWAVAVIWTTLLAIMLFCSGCEEQSEAKTDLPAVTVIPPPIDVPRPVRNYLCHRRGSCLHAAVQDLLRWRGLTAEADYWRAHFGGPANVQDVAAIADKLGLRHSEIENGDEAFLEFVTLNQLGAAIYWQVDRPHDHAIVFCGFDRGDAVLLGVNRPELVRMPKAEFLRRWRECDGGAFTILP